MYKSKSLPAVIPNDAFAFFWLTISCLKLVNNIVRADLNWRTNTWRDYSCLSVPEVPYAEIIFLQSGRYGQKRRANCKDSAPFLIRTL